MKTFCKDCEYFNPLDNKTYGFCHKNAPLAQSSNSNFATFPRVKIEDFCFEGQIEDFCFEGQLKVTETVGLLQPIEEPQLLVEEKFIKSSKEEKIQEAEEPVLLAKKIVEEVTKEDMPKKSIFKKSKNTKG